MIEKGDIIDQVNRILPDIVDIRHRLHQNPELALEEHQTAAFIRETLGSLDLKLHDPFFQTDVVALLEGSRDGKNVTLRADMDALPLTEETGKPYRSTSKGIMHACGHDGHMAMLIGAAMVLGRLKGELNGSVRFIFQPGEEVVAAGKDLVEKGALKHPTPDALFAFHGWPGMPVGSIASKPGVFLVAADFFKIVVKGREAHGSAPEASIDPILTAARIVEGLQAIPSRRISALDSVVLSVCRIQGGTNSNIIPGTTEMEGTVRYANRGTGRQIPRMMEQIVKGICSSMGATYDFSYAAPYVPTVNDPGIVDVGRDIVQDLFGTEYWIDLDQPAMAAEDFAYYIEDHPGAMFRLGMGEDSPSLHHPEFDFNDDALKNGILFLVSAALHICARPPRLSESDVGQA